MITNSPGVFVEAHHAPLVAAALRLFATTQGGLPAYARDLEAEFDSLAAAVSRIGGSASRGNARIGGSEPPVRAGERTLSGEAVGPRLAAQQLGIDERTVRQLCSEGRLAASKRGARWVIPTAAVDAYDRERRKR